eukprot:COSAG02_NODE_1787_length_10931_cov_2.224889_1_plen_284_part_00
MEGGDGGCDRRPSRLRAQGSANMEVLPLPEGCDALQSCKWYGSLVEGSDGGLYCAPCDARGVLRLDCLKWLARQDLSLPLGTRVRVDSLGDGVCVGFTRRRLGANDHLIDFGAAGDVQRVRLKTLATAEWRVLPPLPAPVATVLAVEVVGGAMVEVPDVPLDWTVSKLNAAIAHRRQVSPDAQRLVLKGEPLDDESARLENCGIIEGTQQLHVMARDMVVASPHRGSSTSTIPPTGPASESNGHSGHAGIAEGEPRSVGRTSKGGSEHGRGNGCGWCCGAPGK